MNDRELLEAAAKAAGIRLEWDGPPADWVPMYYEGKTYHAWEPLDDDGDALRLAVKLGLHVDVQKMAGCTVVFLGGTFFDDQLEWHDPDAGAATRRAIVRAAAKLASSDNLPNIA